MLDFQNLIQQSILELPYGTTFYPAYIQGKSSLPFEVVWKNLIKLTKSPKLIEQKWEIRTPGGEYRVELVDKDDYSNILGTSRTHEIWSHYSGEEEFEVTQKEIYPIFVRTNLLIQPEIEPKSLNSLKKKMIHFT